jgi:hypothetical protein
MHVVCNICNEHCCKNIIFSNVKDLLINVKLCKFLYKEIYCTFHSFMFPKYIFLITYSLVVTLIVYLFTSYVTPIKICYCVCVFPKLICIWNCFDFLKYQILVGPSPFLI